MKDLFEAIQSLFVDILFAPLDALRALELESWFSANFMSWIFILISNICFCLHLLLMWLRLGRKTDHPTLLETGHHESSPHGEDGAIQTI